MTTYIIVGAVINFVLGWAWYTYLFPKVQEEYGGKPSMRELTLYAVSALIFAAAVGTFIKNRNVLDTADTLRLGFKIWLGFTLPISLGWWAATRKSLTAFVADTGFWLVASIVLAVLAASLLL